MKQRYGKKSSAISAPEHRHTPVKSFYPAWHVFTIQQAAQHGFLRYTLVPVSAILASMPDYLAALNDAQREAATSTAPHTLVVAGAGSGKTRAIVHRLAWLVDQGITPESILLLTFTRKAANEMLTRAGKLLGAGLHGLPGGTFHSFAFNTLRIYHPAWLGNRPFTLMDSSDIGLAVKQCRDALQAGKGDPSFPKTPAIVSLLSKARNKEQPIAELLRRESYHLLPHLSVLEEIASAYATYKRERGLLDYDDLLFELEGLLSANEAAAFDLRNRFRHILVDEYQDTNLVQARIVWQLAQTPAAGSQRASVMAVGDEAQSIYAFRGANVQNILNFPKLFPETKIIRLEQNYRSTQPILDVANGILANAAESYDKHLFTTREGGDLPLLVKPVSDLSEAELAGQRIRELLATRKAHEIAVLFRAGFHSYALENVLRKAGIPFRKYGGLRFVEAAHVKDLLSFARLALNRHDLPAFVRIGQMHKGVGPKTITKLQRLIMQNDDAALERAFRRYPDFLADLNFVEQLGAKASRPDQFLESLLEYYRPRLETLYPDDWPVRLQGLEEVRNMAQVYESLDLFLADMALDSVEEADDAQAEDTLTLSTIHSAKGLEWSSVIILDAVEDRFPSRHAQARPEDFEEERRLFYVACTRAKQTLDIFAPGALYSHNGGGSATQSPFLRELPQSLFKKVLEKPGYIRIHDQERDEEIEAEKAVSPKQSIKECRTLAPGASGYCRHKIFGRGKILKHLSENHVQVNFPGFGVKTIMAHYLIPEE